MAAAKRMSLKTRRRMVRAHRGQPLSKRRRRAIAMGMHAHLAKAVRRGQ